MGEDVAIKAIYAGNLAKRQQLLNDLRALTTVPCHANLVSFKAAFFPYEDMLTMILNFMDQGDLGAAAGKLPLCILASYTAQILSHPPQTPIETSSRRIFYSTAVEK